MGLARKGSRTIRIDDAVYRWVVSPDSGYMVIVVECDDCDGQRLEANASYGSASKTDQTTRITPETVRRLIEWAVRNGWEPTCAGRPPFQVRDADALLGFTPES